MQLNFKQQQTGIRTRDGLARLTGWLLIDTSFHGFEMNPHRKGSYPDSWKK